MHQHHRVRLRRATVPVDQCAADNGDWYDVPAVLGMLNALATQRGSESRWTTLPTSGQEATVVAGRGPALKALAAEGLITFDDADRAREKGKAFEEKVLRDLGVREE